LPVELVKSSGGGDVHGPGLPAELRESFFVGSQPGGARVGVDASGDRQAEHVRHRQGQRLLDSAVQLVPRRELVGHPVDRTVDRGQGLEANEWTVCLETAPPLRDGEMERLDGL
jgi:hypothetical protein